MKQLRASNGPAAGDVSMVPARVLPFAIEDGLGGLTPPLPTTRTVGRDDDLQRVVETFVEDDTRLVTVLGPGGVGKSHLALVASPRITQIAAISVRFVSLADLREPHQALSFIADALGVFEHPHRSATDRLIEALRHRSVLLLLDNCEHVLDGMGELGTVLGACGGVRVLATSRSPLRLRAERLYALEPLGVPALWAESAVEVLRSPAATLFLERARSVCPDFAIVDANARDVAALLRRLDGLPLAIELMAARIRHLSPLTLLHDLERGDALTIEGARDLPPRQRSLRAVVAWSVERLTPCERAAFRRLSVFRRGFSLKGAAIVVGLDDPAAVHAAVVALVDVSLVQRQVSEANESERFAMLETVQAEAEARLIATGDDQETRKRHAHFFLAFVEGTAHDFLNHDYLRWSEQLDREHDNLLAVLDWAATDSGDPEIGLRVASKLFWFWYLRGLHIDGARRLETLLTRRADTTSPMLVAEALSAVGWLAMRRGDNERTESALREALTLVPISSRVGLRALVGLGYLELLDFSNDQTGEDAFMRVLAEDTGEGEAYYEVMAAHLGLGFVTLIRGDTAGSRARFQGAEHRARDRNDRQNVALSQSYLARVELIEGRPERALTLLVGSLPVFAELGDRGNLVHAVDPIISALGALDRWVDAARLAEAVGRHRLSIGAIRVGFEETLFHADLTATRSALGEKRFDEASAEGGSWGLWGVLNHVARTGAGPDNGSAKRGPDGELGADDTDNERFRSLSKREIEVVRLVARGKTATEIAATLFLSPHTVRRHVANIREKLGVSTQAAAVAELARRGLIEADK